MQVILIHNERLRLSAEDDFLGWGTRLVRETKGNPKRKAPSSAITV